MERIIQLCTYPNDLVVDPFCGSGTTLVAAKLLGRTSVGIDTSQDALDLAKQRILYPVKTRSRLLERGREDYARTDLEMLECLKGIDYHPVHRNSGMDAILVQEWNGKPVCIKIQRPNETIEDAACGLYRAAKGKGGARLILVVTQSQGGLFGKQNVPPTVTLIPSTAAAIQDALKETTKNALLSSASGLLNFKP